MRRIVGLFCFLLCINAAAADNLCLQAPFRYQDKGTYSVEIQNSMNYLLSKWGAIPQDRLKQLVARNADPDTWNNDFKRNELFADLFFYRFSLMQKEVAVVNRARKFLFINSVRDYVENIVELIVELNSLQSSMDTFYKKSIFRTPESSRPEFEIESSVILGKISAEAHTIFRCNYGNVK